MELSDSAQRLFSFQVFIGKKLYVNAEELVAFRFLAGGASAINNPGHRKIIYGSQFSADK